MKSLASLYRWAISFAVVSSIFLAVPLAANAQRTIEEIVVTAQKREESLQNVPITMQAFTGEQLNNLRIGKVSDVTKLAPNSKLQLLLGTNLSF